MIRSSQLGSQQNSGTWHAEVHRRVRAHLPRTAAAGRIYQHQNRQSITATWKNMVEEDEKLRGVKRNGPVISRWSQQATLSPGVVP